MAPPPYILTTHSAAGVQDAYRTAAGLPSADFLPINAVGTHATAERWIDFAGGDHLYRQPGTCERVAIYTSSGAPLWGWRIRQGQRQGGLVCPTVGRWSSAGTQAAVVILSLSASGFGGTFIGPLRGPNRNNPHSGNGNTYGADRGWTLSSNGDGLYGFAFYGTEGIADQDARVFRPNVDMTIGTASNVDRGFRILIAGYSPDLGGAGVGGGYLWTADATQCPVEYFDPGGGVGGAGDLSCPDGRMAVGAVEYGSNTSSTSDAFVTYFDGVVAAVHYFTGAAADNIHANRAAICAAIQATL